MAKPHKNIIQVESTSDPVVELDTSAGAAYIRFSRQKISRTEVINVDHCLVTMDIDAKGGVIGIEMVGVAEFGIEKLIKKAGINGVSAEQMRNARYVSANAEAVAV